MQNDNSRFPFLIVGSFFLKICGNSLFRYGNFWSSSLQDYFIIHLILENIKTRSSVLKNC